MDRSTAEPAYESLSWLLQNANRKDAPLVSVETVRPSSYSKHSAIFRPWIKDIVSAVISFIALIIILEI